MKDLVSIIIPVYDKERYLERCLDSIKNQSYKNIEILLIDDGSTDNSGLICDQYKELDKRFRVYHIANNGVSNARNCGLENAKGEYISFVDPDDFIADTYIEELMNSAEETGTKIVTCHAHIIFDTEIVKNSIPVSEYKREKKIISINEYDYTAYYAHFMVWGAIYHKNIIKGIRFSSEYRVGEDFVFFGEALKKARVVTDIDLSLYYYVQYENSLSHGEFNRSRFTEILAWKHMCQIYQNEGIIPSISCIVALCLCCYVKFVKASMGEINIDRYYRQKMLNCMRKNKKDVLKCKNIKVITKISYIFFCFIPNIASILYCLLKKSSDVYTQKM